MSAMKAFRGMIGKGEQVLPVVVDVLSVQVLTDRSKIVSWILLVCGSMGVLN